jgi:hypothetical protein
MKVWLLVVFILSGIYCHAQLSMQDSTLYLRLEKVDENEIFRVAKSVQQERVYHIEGDNLSCGYPHWFESKDGANADTITVQESRQLPIVSIKKLKAFIRKNYGYVRKTNCYNGRKYFQNLKHIYFLEEISPSHRSVTEVRIIFILD